MTYGITKEGILQKCDFFTGIPSSALKDWIAQIPEEKHCLCTSEYEAVGIAFGAWLAGKRPCVYMQSDGIGVCLNALTSLVLPYGAEIWLVVGLRTDGVHYQMGKWCEQFLCRIGYRNYVIHTREGDQRNTEAARD